MTASIGSSFSSTALALGLASTGCLLSPTDDMRVGSTTAALPFTGYATQASAQVQVRAWSFASHAMANVGAPVFASTSETAVDGGPLFSWTASRTLAPSFWRTGPAGGQCAGVGATVTQGGSTYNAMTVESSWADCWEQNPSVGGFASNCASNHSPAAKLYTTDWGSITVAQSLLDLAGLVATSQITLTLDNFTPTAYQFCSPSHPELCPPGGGGDPETWKFFAPNAASLTRTGSPPVTFSIVPSRHDPMTIYIDNLISNRFDFTTRGDRFVIGINFETAGPEIRMNCIRNAACAFVDGRTIELDTPRAELSFALITDASDRIVFSDVVATFTTSTTGSDATEAATAIGAAMTEKLTGEPAIRSGVASAIDAVLRQSAGLSASFPIDGVTVGSGSVRVRPGCLLD